MKTIDTNEAARLVQEGEQLTHGQRMRLVNERLHALVDYARENSPYFREKYKDLPADYSLTDIPVTQKSEIQENFDEYVTEREVTLAGAEGYCESDNRDGKLFLDKYTVLHTSGTTGKPMYMVRDDHRNKLQGQLVAQRLLKGFPPDIMDHRKHKLAAVIFGGRGASSYESYLRQRAMFPGYEDMVTAVSIFEDPRVIVEKLNEFKPEVLTGYASVLTLLGLEKQKGNLDISVKVIFNSAEALSEEKHKLIEEAFHCPVKNNYCMTEGGEIAMTRDGADMLCNEDFIIVEPCDEKGVPLKDPDEWSQGILVTDLTNYVQPIIRYYVSDSVKVERIGDDEVRLPVLKINGRVNEVFELCGMANTTTALCAQAEFYPGILDMQFTQVADDELRVRAYTHNEEDKEQILKGLCGELKEYLSEHGCPDAKVTYSLEAPIRKEKGGKSPKYVDLR